MTDETILALTDQIVWPIALVVIIITLRKPITTCVEAIIAWIISW